MRPQIPRFLSSILILILFLFLTRTNPPQYQPLHTPIVTMLPSRRLLVQKARSQKCIEHAAKRIKSTSVAEGPAIHESVERPTNKQLWRVFTRAAVPMVGFGFTDQTVMLQAGNAIDCTLGVTFGMSTLVGSSIWNLEFPLRILLVDDFSAGH